MITRIFSLWIAIVIVCAAAGPVAAQEAPPAGSHIYLPLAQIGPTGCGSGGGTGPSMWAPVTDQGIDVWIKSRCEGHVHVWYRLWYTAPTCIGYCQTSWGPMDEDWIIINRVMILNGEIVIIQWGEFLSVMNIPFTLDIYGWPPLEQ